MLHMFSQLLIASRGTRLLNIVNMSTMPCILALKVDDPSPMRLMDCRKYLVRLLFLFIINQAFVVLFWMRMSIHGSVRERRQIMSPQDPLNMGNDLESVRLSF